MRVTLASERPTVIDVWRDSDPLPGEKPIKRVLVESNDSYHSNPSNPERTVSAHAHVSTPRLQQFLVEKSPEADRLIAALKEGPIKPNQVRLGEVTMSSLLDVLTIWARRRALAFNRYSTRDR